MTRTSLRLGDLQLKEVYTGKAVLSDLQAAPVIAISAHDCRFIKAIDTAFGVLADVAHRLDHGFRHEVYLTHFEPNQS